MRKANNELGREEKCGRWDRTHRWGKTEAKETNSGGRERREKAEVQSA